VPAVAVNTAVDLGGEESGAPPAKCSNSSFLEGAVYAVDALAGDPLANSHFMKLHKRGPACNLMWFCARIQLRRVRVDFICKSFMNCDL
jgi:hypothetical protein